MNKVRRIAWRIVKMLAAVAILLAVLYVANGLLLNQNAPVVINIAANQPAAENPDAIRVLTYNVHQCGAVRKGGFFGATFGGHDEVRDKVGKIAAFLKEQNADIVILNEVAIESPGGVNQVESLAREAGYPFAVFGHNGNFGLPFLRYREGNAILSRFPIVKSENLDIVPAASPLGTGISRRLLRITIDMGGKEAAVYAVHLAANMPEKNLEQAQALRKILEAETLPVILAGDFNATPDSPSMLEIRGIQSLRGPASFGPTYVAYPPERRLDYVFGPTAWVLVSEEVLMNNLSDHYAVLANFQLK